MKHKLTLLLILNVVLGSFVGHAQVTATIHLADNTTATSTLDPSGEIYFQNDRLVIMESALSGNTQSWPMDQVTKVTFDGEPNAILAPESSRLSLYPNPAHSSVQISGIGLQPQPLTIYSATGAQLLQQTVVDGNTIDVSHLRPGIYFARIGLQTLKLAIH